MSGALIALYLLLCVGAAHAHPPLPASVLDPRTIPEAWNVLRLSTANVERLLRENRLAEIPDQVSLCSPALRALARLAPAENQTSVAGRTVRASGAVISVAQAAMAGDRATAASTFDALRAGLRELAGSFDPAAVNAEIYFCPMHPDVLHTEASAHCERCGMALARRVIPYSFIYVPPGEPTIVLSTRTEPPLAAGRASRVTFRLRQRDGSPVRTSDLQMVHTRPIHLLIVDPGLEDYHHEHPDATDTPGEYTASFTPMKSSNYRMFVDLVPLATGTQEYLVADLPGTVGTPFASKPHGENTSASEAGGLRFVLGDDPLAGGAPRARQVRNLTIAVAEPNGQPAVRLEPVMNAFAHLVGFYDDGLTVVHIHPEGGEVNDPASRGGPSLAFRFYPPKAGFLRLFCQVQVDGRPIYAPFNVNVQP